jgi:hypothetical protein
MGKDGTELLDPVGAPATDEAAPVQGRAHRDKLVFRSALVIAALPFVVTALAMILTVGGDYHPAGDLAMTEMHIRDIGHHEVLIGLHSRWTWSHLGPMQFYLVAPFYWLSGDSSIGMVLGALALNLASIIGILVISRRRAAPRWWSAACWAACCWPARWGPRSWATRGTSRSPCSPSPCSPSWSGRCGRASCGRCRWACS